MKSDILTIMAHEISVQLRSAKAWIFAFTYGLAYFFLGKTYLYIEEWLNKFSFKPRRDLIQSRDIIEYFTGGQPGLTEHFVSIPLMLLFFFWFSLFCLPLFIFLLSYDSFSQDLHDRSIRFVLIRSKRSSLFAGKLFAYTIIFAAFTFIVNIAFLSYAQVRLSLFDFTPALFHTMRFWSLSILYGLTFLSFTIFLSTMLDRPHLALISGIMIFIFFMWMKHQPELKYLTPFYYKGFLWYPLSWKLLSGIAAYLGFTAVFTLGGMWVLSRRDV